MSSSVYWSAPVSLCYDNEGAGDESAGEEGTGDEGAGDEGAAAAEGGQEEVLALTQSKLNEMMANHKRNLQAELQQTKASLAETETQLKELLTNKELGDETTSKLQETLTNVQKQLKTKEQLAQQEKQRLEAEYEAQLDEALKGRDEAVATLNAYRKERALIDAVGDDAYNMQQFIDLMAPRTQMVDGELMVDLPDLDVDGNPTTSQLTPTEAVARMKEVPQLYGNQFKSNIINGVGGSNATGGVNSGNQNIVIDENTSFDDFKRIFKENPEALGL